jgi:hypothetical protein
LLWRSYFAVDRRCALYPSSFAEVKRLSYVCGLAIYTLHA